MKLLLPSVSHKQIDDAGELLVAFDTSTEAREKALILAFLVLVEWRDTHLYPLRVVRTILGQHARKFDPSALVYGRPKRRPAIIAKLARFKPKHMKLTRMDDIGACRAVLGTIEQVNALAEHFRIEIAHKLDEEPKERNYISSPKEDGYRSVHLIVRYKSKYVPDFNRRIEIQIRSRLQHQWATALETVDLFSGQALKFGGGDTRWKRFFALTSSLIALKENCSIVPGTPSDVFALIQEITFLLTELQVVQRLSKWTDIMRFVIPDSSDAGPNAMYLIELDTEEKTTSVRGWPAHQLEEARSEYAAVEKRNAGNPHKDAVLATAESVGELRQAFPSYYGDTRDFLITILAEIRKSLE